MPTQDTLFPINYDAPVDPTQFDHLDTAGVEHDLVHQFIHDAIKEIEYKLGINGSVDTGSLEYKARTHDHSPSSSGATTLSPTSLAVSGTGSIGGTFSVAGTTTLGVLNAGATTLSSLTVTGALNMSTPLPIGSGGTGSAVQNFVDLTTNQDIGGAKNFTAATLSAVRLILGNPLTVGYGGTGSTSQNWVDLTTAQTVNGLKKFVSGLDVQGSSDGYTAGELRFTGTTAGGLIGIATLATGSPRMLFDHRAAGNTGDWYFRNGTGAGTPVLGISSSGTVTANGDLISGNGMSHIARNNSGVNTAWLEGAQARAGFQGDQNGLIGYNTAGDVQYLLGLRSDISGNAQDLVIYTYNGGISIYPTGQTNRSFQIAIDGTIDTHALSGVAIGAYGLDVDCSSNNGYTTIRAKSAWTSGAGTGYFSAENVNGRVFEIDAYGRISFPSATTQGPIVTGSASAGLGAPLPATPHGYLMVQIAGTTMKVPYYQN